MERIDFVTTARPIADSLRARFYRLAGAQVALACWATTALLQECANVCFWHKADISRLSFNVRFRG
jgi:hypothetical protein